MLPSNVFLFKDKGRGIISQKESGKIILPDKFSSILPKDGEYWEVNLIERDRFCIARLIKKVEYIKEYILKDTFIYEIEKIDKNIINEYFIEDSYLSKYPISKVLLEKYKESRNKKHEENEKKYEIEKKLNKQLKSLASKLFGKEEEKIENERKIELEKVPTLKTNKIEEGEYYYKTRFFGGSGIMTDKKSVRRGSWMFSEYFNKKDYYGKVLASYLEEYITYQAELTKYILSTNKFSVEKTALKIIGHEKEKEKELKEKLRKELINCINSYFNNEKFIRGVYVRNINTLTHTPSEKLIEFFQNHNIKMWWEEGWFTWNDDDEKEIKKIIEAKQ